MQESVAPGSPPMSPPVVWTCHPIYYPSSPPPGGPGNILVIYLQFICSNPIPNLIKSEALMYLN